MKKLAIVCLLALPAAPAWAEEFHTYTNPFTGSVSGDINGRPFHVYTNPFTGSTEGEIDDGDPF
jgi:hypothetical protein